MNDVKLEGLRIGHWHDEEKATGLTVFLLPQGNTTSGFLLGHAPGTREFALLLPESRVSEVNAIVFSGGSAMGLGCAQGVLQFLRETDVGYETPYGRVPIVSAAVIFDLGIGDKEAYPTEEDGYLAASQAKEDSEEGNVGVAMGATIGKWMGPSYAMKGGLGISTIVSDRLIVRSFTVVNALGDVLRNDGAVLGGARHPEGGFWGDRVGYRSYLSGNIPRENTTLSLVITNAELSKFEAYLLARRASQGVLRAIRPVSTSFDGDIIFVVATGKERVDMENLSELAQDAVSGSIRRGVQKAKRLHGIPGMEGVE